MNIISYFQPVRTYLPCTGIGRHICHILMGLAEHKTVNLELFFSHQWLMKDGKLDPRSPLRELPARTFPFPENITERAWKLFGQPYIDFWLPPKTDWVYAPVETYLPAHTCPVAVTLHDIQAFESNLPWSHTRHHYWFRYKWERWVRRALRDCRIIFTVSEFSKQRMVALLEADPNKIVVVGNGIEPNFFKLADVEPVKLKSPVERPYVLVIGGLRIKKGAEYILAVARILKQHKSDLQIVIAGESEFTYIQQTQEYKNITLLGMVSDFDLLRILRGASSLLFLSPYEGFGIPAIEAMATGIPTVVANRAALPEVVGDAGFIVEPDATEEIVEILITLEKDANLHQEYSKRGRIHANRYHWSSCVTRVLTALEQFG